MCVTAIVGANWGDEGKGKMTDYLAKTADVVIRFQGGNNAGHTIINDYGKFALHLLPSGVFNENTLNIIGPGVAFNINAFLDELNELIDRGVPHPKIAISERAQIVMPYHIISDQYEEDRLGDNRFGSTRTGMAPFYSDKYLKIGIQVADLFEGKNHLIKKIRTGIEKKNILLENLYFKNKLSATSISNKILKMADLIKPFVKDTTSILFQAVEDKKHILVEGQLGALRDPDHGIYPFTTSSSTLAGFSTIGAGLPPHQIKRIVAVVKAYSSCVGAGPFVTEIFDDEAHQLRIKGGDSGEYGATTGRPRRMGWFDGVATKYGCRLQGATEISLTLLDVLSYLDEIPVCIGYKIDDEITTDFPVTTKLSKATPIYKVLPGWKTDISSIRKFEDLPSEAKNYVNFVSDFISLPIKWISVGPHRDNTIIMD